MTERKAADAKHDDAVSRMETTNLRYNRLKLGLTFLTLLVVVVGFTLSAVASSQQRDDVLACTVPEHEGTCYEEGQRRTGEAVLAIVEGVAKDNDQQTKEIIEKVKRLFNLEE